MSVKLNPFFYNTVTVLVNLLNKKYGSRKNKYRAPDALCLKPKMLERQKTQQSNT